MARPRKTIDYDLVERLASIHCTQEEIAAVLEVSVKTLQRRKKFSRIYKNAQDKGKASLRRLQFKSAEKGNVTMQIWLGKQLLGQRDQLLIDAHSDSTLDPLTQSIIDSFSGDNGKVVIKSDKPPTA